MKIIHHNDLDGHCAGAIALKKFPEAELIEMNYGWPFPWNKIKQNETVIMVDFGLQPFSDMIKLATHANLIWIDHHKSALEDARKCGFSVQGLRKDGKAGCELTWKYFFPDEPTPRAVTLLGRFDVWDLEYSPLIMPFKYGMEARDTCPDNAYLWDTLLKDDRDTHRLMEDILKGGHAIEKFTQRKWATQAKDAAFEVEFDGLKCIAMNIPGYGSLPFKSVWDPKKHDAMMSFGWVDGKWTVGLYTDNKPGVDVSKTAKAYGGGGHAGSSGFQCDELPFELKKAA